MMLFSGNCFADTKENVYDAKELSNDYKDISDMFSIGVKYNDYSELYKKATLYNHRFNRKYQDEILMQNIIDEANQVQSLYDLISNVWAHKITSNTTDISLSSDIRNKYPRLKELHGDMWGDFDTDRVLQILIEYQDEKIKNFDSMIKTIDHE
jgi:hypothetical protein